MRRTAVGSIGIIGVALGLGVSEGAGARQSQPSAVHVTPYGRAWAVRRADEGEPLSQHTSRADAVAQAARIAAAIGAELVLYAADWRVVSQSTRS